MTMLADDPAVEEIVFGTGGVASAMKAGAIHVSHSTIGTALARKLTAEHARRSQGYLSVPVFGGPNMRKAKKLVVVAAGPLELVDSCRPLFDAIGRATFVVGSEPWQANLAKVCGNFMVIGVVERMGKPMRRCERQGLPRLSSMRS